MALPTRVRPVGVDIAAAAVGQSLLLALLWATVGLGPAALLVGLLHAAATSVLLVSALHQAGIRALGTANRITLARSVLVGGVTALVVEGARDAPAAAVLTGLATVALVLDAVDGWAARRSGAVTALGARFDMEVDAFLILVLSVAVAASLGPWVLLIGLTRYAFGAAAAAVPWLRAPLPPSTARKAVAAAQGIVLVVAASRVLPEPVAAALVAAALAGLGWSFGRDIRWLRRLTRGAR